MDLICFFTTVGSILANKIDDSINPLSYVNGTMNSIVIPEITQAQVKVQDIYYIAVLKFYFKLVNNHLPHYFNNFTPQFSAGHQHYNFRNPTRLLPKIKHEFPRQSLRYRLIVTLNETSYDILEMATTQSQKCFTKFIRERIVAGYSYTCNLVICHICDGR